MAYTCNVSINEAPFRLTLSYTEGVDRLTLSADIAETVYYYKLVDTLPTEPGSPITFQGLINSIRDAIQNDNITLSYRDETCTELVFSADNIGYNTILLVRPLTTKILIQYSIKLSELEQRLAALEAT